MYVCVCFYALSPNIPSLRSHQIFPSLVSLSLNIPSPPLSPYNLTSTAAKQVHFPPLTLTKYSLPPNVAKYSLPSLSPNSHQIFPHPLSQNIPYPRSLSPNIPSPRSRQVLSPLTLAKYSFPSLSLNTPSLRYRQILPPLFLAKLSPNILSPHFRQIFSPPTLVKYSLLSLSPNIPSPPHSHQIFPPIFSPISHHSHQIFPLSLSPNIPSPHFHQIFSVFAFAKYLLPSLSLNSRQIFPLVTLAKYSLPHIHTHARTLTPHDSFSEPTPGVTES